MGGFYKMENAILSILTQNEELLRELKKEQEKQAVILDSVMSNVDSLMSDVDTIRGAIK
jgi:hypothetical protein